MKSNEEIKSYLKSNLNDHRFNHCIGVYETCKKLAHYYGADEEKSALAGLVHDCAKHMRADKMIALLESHGEEITLEVKNNIQVMHGYAGAYLAEEIFEISDEDILNAVKYHVTGRENMSLLEKIVFIADYIEPGRDFLGVEEARVLAYEDLDKALLYALDNTINNVVKSGYFLYTKTIDARNYLISIGIENSYEI
ncbi:MAG: bis(5'-nucleosyl)-tetraphosphatase (symmetrical) YqeK [Clostridium sp.]